jgi:hypothetical protein
MTPSSRACSKIGGRCARWGHVVVPTFVVTIPPSRHSSSPSPLLFIRHLPAIRHPRCSLSLQFVICWCWRSLWHWRSLVLVFAVVGIRWCWHSLVLAFVGVVVRCPMFHRRQHHHHPLRAGGVVALSDVALGVGVAA